MNGSPRETSGDASNRLLGGDATGQDPLFVTFVALAAVCFFLGMFVMDNAGPWIAGGLMVWFAIERHQAN